MKINIKSLIICLLIPLAVGSISGWITSSEIGSWYMTLQKPSWNPPSWIFGPVWTTLYLLMGYALYLITVSETTVDKKLALQLFAVQLFLNFWWSILFFSFHQIGLALIEIVSMWIAILFSIIWFSRINKQAAWLLVPYIAWVTFATLLNFTLYQLNP